MKKSNLGKAAAIPILVLLLSSLIVAAMPFVYAASNTTTEEEPPESAQTEEQTEEQPTQSEEEVIPTQEEAPASETTLSKAEENAEEAITSNDDDDDEINPCLLDPSLPTCPKPGPNQDCPEGWAQNEDGNCFPLHPEGCPRGYHGHEDDETGRCIPNSTPCDPNYILVTGENANAGRKNCERKESYCQTHQNDNRCRDDNDNGKDDDHDKKVIIIKKFIKDIDIINKIDDADSNGDLDIAQTIVAINYNEGAGINCVFDEDDNGQCETFDVTQDKGKEPLLQIIDFTS